MAAPRPIGFWLRLVDTLIDEQFAGLLEEHGVTRRQWQLMNVLAEGPASREQLDAAVAPFLDATADESSVAHLAELVDSGWVAGDEAGYEVTEQGATAFDGLQEAVARTRARTAEGISEDDYATTLEVLEQMARNLGWAGE